MLAKHISPTPSRQQTALASTRLSDTALGPGGRGAEASMEHDESPLEAILCGLCVIALTLTCLALALMSAPR